MQEVNNRLKKELVEVKAINKALTIEVDILKSEAKMASTVKASYESHLRELEVSSAMDHTGIELHPPMIDRYRGCRRPHGAIAAVFPPFGIAAPYMALGWDLCSSSVAT
ncbi:hypothetical protein Pfo_005361 [Paulownia fortunei]|nr:hypothetical protein Pfo_005361 [Paulownia fortunei]